MRKYLAMAEQKTEEARQESHQTVIDVDDLDVLQTPEKCVSCLIKVNQSVSPKNYLLQWMQKLLYTVPNKSVVTQFFLIYFLQFVIECCQWRRHTRPNRPCHSDTLGQVLVGVLSPVSGPSPQQQFG